VNCYGPDDPAFLADSELADIDAMEDALGTLDEETVRIRQVITGFEACYHEADKEAEFIVGAIGTGQCPERSNERPAERKRELDNARYVLSCWCEDPARRKVDREVGGVRADELLSCLGAPSPLKVWQVQRVVDKIASALDPNQAYHNLALGVADYGEPVADAAGKHCADNPDFRRRTAETIIDDTLDGKPSKVSLGFAIDLLMPCGWDFVGYLLTICKAIGGDLRAERPLACCARNIKRSPLCDRLRTISYTLGTFWKTEPAGEAIDRDILAALGAPNPTKRWLAASLDKTIRLHLSLPFPMDLF
jgi:hypothetical protein